MTHPEGREAAVCATCRVCGHEESQHIAFGPAGDCGFWGCIACCSLGSEDALGRSHRHFYIAEPAPTAPPPAAAELFEDICPRCLAVSMVDGNLPSGQFCARCAPVAAAPSEARADDPWLRLRSDPALYNAYMHGIATAREEMDSLRARLATAEAERDEWKRRAMEPQIAGTLTSPAPSTGTTP